MRTSVGAKSIPKCQYKSASANFNKVSSSRWCIGMPSRPSDTRSTIELSVVCTCDHLFEANDTAVTAVCSGFGTKYPLPTRCCGHMLRGTVSSIMTTEACSRAAKCVATSLLNDSTSVALCLAGEAITTASHSTVPSSV